MTHCEIFFFWCVFNDGYNKFVVEAIVLSSLSPTDALDHLLVSDPKLFTGIEKSGHHCSFGVSVDHSSSPCVCKEERESV